MRTFIEVAKELNYGRAAVILHISQPAVSQQIRQLERAVGTPLLERNSRSVALTSAGRAFLPRCEETLETADSAVREALNAVSGDRGIVRLGFAGAMAGPHVSAATKEVRERFPGIELRISASLHTAGVLEQLSANKLDVGFMAQQRDVAGISTRLVSAASLCAVVPLDHRLAGRDGVALATLVDEPFVLMASAAGLRLGDLAVQACLDVGFSPKVAQEAPDTYTLLALVSAGVGISVVPDVMEGVWTGGAAFIPLTDVDRVLNSVVAWRQASESGALRKVLEIIEDMVPTPGINN